METATLSDSPLHNRECRLCLMDEPQKDLIHPCACTGTLRYAHRKCLDRWRTVSPHPDSLTTCEICKSKFQIVYNIKDNKCKNRFFYCMAVTLDVLFFLAIVGGLWIGFGYLGDEVFNGILTDIFYCPNTTPKPPTSTPTAPPTALPLGCSGWFHFAHDHTVWSGRVWFWGFICLFFVLGIVGCFFFCCCREEGDSSINTSSHDYHSRGDCYWICCGPTYYNGYYYGTPYGYWNSTDILCCWYCTSLHTNAHHYHHHASSGCDCTFGGCSGGDCGNFGGCKDSKDGSQVFLIIFAVIVLIVVVCGVAFAAFVSFMIMNKIIKRHLYLLEKQQVAESEMVVDLEDLSQVSKASQQTQEGFLPKQEKQPLILNDAYNYPKKDGNL